MRKRWGKGSLPASVLGRSNARIGRGVFGRASGRRVSEIVVRSMAFARSPNKSLEPTRSSALGIRKITWTSNINSRVAHL
jgi:hypothetical protein